MVKSAKQRHDPRFMTEMHQRTDRLPVFAGKRPRPAHGVRQVPDGKRPQRLGVGDGGRPLGPVPDLSQLVVGDRRTGNVLAVQASVNNSARPARSRPDRLTAAEAARREGLPEAGQTGLQPAQDGSVPPLAQEVEGARQPDSGVGTGFRPNDRPVVVRQRVRRGSGGRGRRRAGGSRTSRPWPGWRPPPRLSAKGTPIGVEG
jgi:hypothetical protein